jgi:hypothetical protein
MTQDTEFAKARLVVVTRVRPNQQEQEDEQRNVTVHFNPTSLQYTVTNTLRNPGSGTSTRQYVSQSTSKLTMDLIFDTTGTGVDVREFTGKVAGFMEPGRNHAPPLVKFEWGVYKFIGMVESYKETIDFFAPSGVPLRASVNLTLSRQDNVFASGASSNRVGTSGALTPDQPSGAVKVPGGRNNSAADLSSRAGNPDAQRSIGAANGLESLRAGTSADLTVSDQVQLAPPLAFSTGAGAGIGIIAGAATGAGISLGAGVSSAGVAAAAGAFAGLRADADVKISAPLDVSRLLPGSGSLNLAGDIGASFNVGGLAASAAGSLDADVGAGAGASLSARIQFDES